MSEPTGDRGAEPRASDGAQPRTPDDVPPPKDWAPETKEEGFWTRVKHALGGTGEAAPPPPPPQQTAIAPTPRKIRRTVFDGGKKAESRGTRLRRISQEKRESLALVVGAEMEKVIVEKIQPRDEALGKVADGFGALEGALSKIPEATGAQLETLGGQLVALNQVRGELELQRAQRERVIEGVARLEKAIHEVTAKIEAQSRQTAEETERMERSMAFFAARVHEQSSAILSAQEAALAGARSSHASMLDAMEEMHERTIGSVERLLEDRSREAREKEAREEAREREKEARRRQRDARERAFFDREKAVRRGRRARFAAALLVLVAAAGGAYAVFGLDEQRASVARDAEERADRALELIAGRAAPVSSLATTLPAGFPK